MDPREALKELARRKEEEKCRFFIPNLKQHEYITLIGSGHKFVNLFIAANGVGKDCVAMNILANICWGPQNDYFRGLPIFERWPFPEKHVRIVTESSLLTDSGPTDKEINRWWPKNRYEASKQGKQYVSQYKTDTGFLIDKMSYQQDPSEFEGVTLGAVFFSEPPPKDIFNRCVSRLRRGGIIAIYMTPLTSAAWIQDELLDAKDTGFVYADIEANCKQHGTRGNLEHVHIEQMMSKWDPEEVEARAYGRFTHLSNVILGKTFNRQYHVIPDDTPMPDGAQRFHVVDPARGKPWAMGWGWVDMRGRIVFEEEYPTQEWTKIKGTDLSTKDYVDLIRVKERGNPVEWRIIDRHYSNARDDYGNTLKLTLSDKFGLEFQNSYNCEEEIETGIQRIIDLMRVNTRMPVDESNFPKLCVKARCHNIIRALERWDRDQNTMRPKAESPYKDHFDIVRYVAMAGLEPYIPRQFEKRGLGYVQGR